MPEYEIRKWNSVLPENRTFPFPMVYFKPDKNFIEYAKENDYKIMAEISGTNLYDGTPILGVLDSSGYFPDYRPYFYNETGDFVIMLITEWKGYPKTNGKIVIRGMKGEDKLEAPPPQPFKVPQAIEMFTMDTGGNQSGSKTEKKSDKKILEWSLIIIGVILVIVGVIIMMAGKSQNKI